MVFNINLQKCKKEEASGNLTHSHAITSVKIALCTWVILVSRVTWVCVVVVGERGEEVGERGSFGEV